MGQDKGLSWTGNQLSRLHEGVEPGAVFPLQTMDANLVRRHPGPPDAPVCGLHQSDGNLTLDISTRPGVGLPPL